jgi:hypothetical protein
VTKCYIETRLLPFVVRKQRVEPTLHRREDGVFILELVILALRHHEAVVVADGRNSLPEVGAGFGR